jgi:pimeloyl-ACP methyl ester carboxylesterase
MGGAIRVLAFPHPDRRRRAHLLNQCPELIWLQTSDGRTPAVHIQRKDSTLTLLYTHGNAEDLGDILDLLRHTSTLLDVSILAVEIPGYSISEAEQPSEELMYEAAENAYAYLVTTLGIPPERIVPYGRSLGSAPAVHVASNHPEIRGLILVSPLKSGGHAFAGEVISFLGSWVNPFKNYEKIE